MLFCQAVQLVCLPSTTELPDTQGQLAAREELLDSFEINLVSSRTFRGPLFHKPGTVWELFLEAEYNELTLVIVIVI